MDPSINQSLTSIKGELRSFVLKKVKDQVLADDIVQDVFLKVYTRIGQLRDSGKLVSWIYQIARNTIADHFRQRRKPEPDDIDWEEQTNRLNECVSICLRKLVHTLPEKYQEAFTLSDMDGISQTEIARRLGISYSGAKSRVQRARQLLRQKMEEILIIKTDCYGNILVCEDRTPCQCQPNSHSRSGPGNPSE